MMKIEDINNNNAKKKKGFITEEDTATLLQRYSATQILALLQEVAHFTEVEVSEKIDYEKLLAKTTTGITNAREYQMLWRHLAYREPLSENIDDGAEAMMCDIDSDLEYEVEVAPPVSAEASTEAAACVKVLIASGLPSDSSHLNGTTVEAPLTINIPNGFKKYESSSSGKGVNITVPVSVQKQTLPATATTAIAKVEGDDANGPTSGTMPPRKKRKKWSNEEDSELISAVDIYGEGNWTQIVKAHFKGDRTANQLSQRWGIIMKRHKKSGPGEGDKQSVKTEALLAAHQTMTHFLDNGLNRTPITVGTGGTNVNINTAEPKAHDESVVTNGIHNSGPPTTIAEGLNAKKTIRIGSFGPIPKGRIASKKTLPKPNPNMDPLRATAVAAGARIVSPSDAEAELLKAAQAKNAIHIMPQTGVSIKSSAVPHIRTGPVATLPSPHPSTKQAGSVKAVPQTSQQALNTESCPAAQVLPKPIQTRENPSSLEQVQGGKSESPMQKSIPKSSLTNARNPATSLDTTKGPQVMRKRFEGCRGDEESGKLHTLVLG